jgi:hypothetical protein
MSDNNIVDDRITLTVQYPGVATNATAGTIAGTPNLVVDTEGADPDYIILGANDADFIYLLDDDWLLFNDKGGIEVDVVPSFVQDNAFRIYYTGDVHPKQTNSALATSGSAINWPTTFYRWGVEKPVGSLTATVNTGAGSIDSEFTTNYVYTYVTSFGEEGPYGTASSNVDVAINDSVTLTGFQYPTATHNNIETVRIYRVNTGDVTGAYQLVNSVDLDIDTAVTVGYVDDVSSTGLGAAVTTRDYDPLPDAAQGVIQYSQGLYAAFRENAIYISEPSVAYAFPTENIITISGSVVGLASFGDGILALTNSNPVVLLGTVPPLIKQVLPYKQPCQSKRGITSSKFGVVYPGADGLFQINTSGGTNLTEKILTSTQWQAYDLDSLVGVYHDEKYYGFFKGSATGFIYDFQNPDYIVDFTLADEGLTFRYAVSVGDDLYIATNSVDGTDIKTFGSGSTYLSFTWSSKKFQFAEYQNLSVARIVGSGVSSTYPLTFKLYVDNVLKQTKTITSLDSFFKLPRGFRGKEYYFTLTSTYANTSATTIDIVQLGKSTRDLGFG